MLARLIHEESGQSLVEYGLILGLVSVMLVGALGLMRTGLQNIFIQVGAELDKAARGGKPGR